MKYRPVPSMFPLATFFRRTLPFALCLLLSAFLLFASFLRPLRSRAQTQDAQAQPSPSPNPSPSPSPTPVTGLHQWGAVTLFHGLPSDRVRAIAQGVDGTMWFGTENGLAKFDGRRTQVIKDPALPGTRILCLKMDDDGVLWIGADAGAARIVNGQIENIKPLAGNTVSAISLDRGRVLFATEQGDIYEGSKQGASINVRPLLNEPLQSTDRDHPGPLVITSITTVDGVPMFGTLSRGVLQLENGTVRDESNKRAGFFIRAVATDSKGKLWVGARSKKDEPAVFSGAFNTLKKNEAATGPVLAIQSIGDNVFVGTDGRGVFRFSDEKIERVTFDGTAGGLRSDHVYAIFADREGVIWFGTDRGVSRFDPSAPRAETVSPSPESNFVRTIFQSTDGQLFAGTNRGLFVYEENAKHWTAVEELARNIIYSLAENSAGDLLVGSASGFYVSQRRIKDGEPATLTFNRVEAGSGNADGGGSIRAIASFRGSTYIASFGRGIEQFQDGRIRNVWQREAPSEVISLYSDADSRLIVGTARDGVLYFDGQQVMADPALAQLKGFPIRSIARTHDGTTWYATTRGVYACTSENQCTWTAAGTDARALSPSLEENIASVWCATTGSGLLKISLDKDVGPVVSQLDAEQGLPSQNAFSVLPQANDDNVLIATSRGVVRYSPGHITPTLYATRIISKRVHQPSELSGGLYLEYPQNSLLLDVSAISSRTFPEQFQYAFVLTDSSGQVIKQRLARESQFAMEGLKPGTYRVTARAFTKDLVPSGPLSFQFTLAKAPFPWTSTALAILLALTLLALFWALQERRRIARTSAALVDANRELADARFNLANEAERERRRIARDLHDQTLADLRHLLLLTDQIPGASGVHSNGGETRVGATALRSEIEGISQEVRRICEDLSPSVLQNVGFSAALEFALSHAVQHAPPERKFEYDFICDDAIEEKTKLPSNVQMQIYRIAQEAVNNICRHAVPDHVKMEVTSTPAGDFTMKLEDDGREFDPSDMRTNGRGLQNMQARASLIDAQISWSKREGGGTMFRLHKKHERAKLIIR